MLYFQILHAQLCPNVMRKTFEISFKREENFVSYSTVCVTLLMSIEKNFTHLVDFSIEKRKNMTQKRAPK